MANNLSIKIVKFHRLLKTIEKFVSNVVNVA
jgi:hypothetical protein